MSNEAGTTTTHMWVRCRACGLRLSTPKRALPTHPNKKGTAYCGGRAFEVVISSEKLRSKAKADLARRQALAQERMLPQIVQSVATARPKPKETGKLTKSATKRNAQPEARKKPKEPLLSKDSKRSNSAWDGVRATRIRIVRGGAPGLGKRS